MRSACELITIFQGDDDDDIRDADAGVCTETERSDSCHDWCVLGRMTGSAGTTSEKQQTLRMRDETEQDQERSSR